MGRHPSATNAARRRVLLVAVALIVTPSLQAQPEYRSWPVQQAPVEYQQVVSRGDLIVNALDEAFVRELEDAIARAGIEGALQSCHLDATFMAQRLARYEGIAAGRTSDRLRNPTNAPPRWAEGVVRTHAGEPARSVGGWVVDLGGKVGLLRPIAERPLCHGCHGPDHAVSAGVKAALADRYPADRALGFTDGELRGWFWVELPKPPR